MKSIFQKKNREKESQENQILKNLEKNREIEFQKIRNHKNQIGEN